MAKRNEIATDMETLYVLKLHNDCWYVGKTKDLDRRIKQHSSGKGAYWVKKQGFKCLESSKPVPANYSAGEETKMTAELMLKHGVNSVRGAAFCKTKRYTTNDIDTLVSSIGQALNLNYSQLRDSLQYELNVVQENTTREEKLCECQYCLELFLQRDITIHEKRCAIDACFRCGRASHWASDCYASTHIDGRALNEDSDEYLESEVCFRCGRASHWASDCYASTHIDGRALNEDSDEYLESVTTRVVHPQRAFSSSIVSEVRHNSRTAFSQKRNINHVLHALPAHQYEDYNVFASQCSFSSKKKARCEGIVAVSKKKAEANNGKDCSMSCRGNVKEESEVCFRCGRASHWASDCYASTHIDGRALNEDSDEYLESEVCFRCGRASHWASDCYASRHIDGHKI